MLPPPLPSSSPPDAWRKDSRDLCVPSKQSRHHLRLVRSAPSSGFPSPPPERMFLHISHACELPHPRTVRGRTTNKCSVSLNLRYFSTCLHFYDRALLGRSLCWLATQTKHTLHTQSKRQLTGNWTFHVTIFAARPARPGVPRARAALARAQEKYVFQKICVWVWIWMWR